MLYTLRISANAVSTSPVDFKSFTDSVVYTLYLPFLPGLLSLPLNALSLSALPHVKVTFLAKQGVYYNTLITSDFLTSTTSNSIESFAKSLFTIASASVTDTAETK